MRAAALTRLACVTLQVLLQHLMNACAEGTRPPPPDSGTAGAGILNNTQMGII